MIGRSVACLSEGGFASPSVTLHPISYPRAVAHAMLHGEGFAVTLAMKTGFYDAKLSSWGSGCSSSACL